MDHNLEDSLTMESIENIPTTMDQSTMVEYDESMMEYDHSGVEVMHEGISLDDNSHEDIAMDVDSIQQQPTLLQEGSEEVIVSDFIGSEEFGFQEYSVQTDDSGANITIGGNKFIGQTAKKEQVIDMQHLDQSKPSTSHPGLITIKAISQRTTTKKPAATASFPRQVAIAPKPTKGAPNVQFAIAPKPVAIVMNKSNTKTVSMKNVVQGFKGNTVLAQIGKQLVMVPASAAGQKLKLASVLPGASTDGNNIQLAQLIANKGGVKTKFILQNQPSLDTSDQPAVLSKILPATTAAPTQARYIMQQKTVPISIGGNKVLITTPPKHTIATKKQIISIKTENPKIVTSQANVQTKKIVITANPAPAQLKTAAVKTATQAQRQRTQLHPIHVPGKGIQYIKLVTNQPMVQKATTKPQTISVGGKNFVLTDSKGNIIQMAADKVVTAQPSPLLVAANATAAGKVNTKARKLVRIAPVSAKSETPGAAPRAPQSLLMPRSPPAPAPPLAGTSLSLEEFNEMVEQTHLTHMTLTSEEAEAQEEGMVEQEPVEMEQYLHEPIDIKPTLASLISDAVSGEDSSQDLPHMEEVEIEYESMPRKQEYFQEDDNTTSMDNDDESFERKDDSLIVVPSNAPARREHETLYQEDSNTSPADNSRLQAMASIETDALPYGSPEMEQGYNESMLLFESGKGGGLRPRKACNCTKSQCLKLYCDCFANGEFCNQCNCNNCHNNLDHEDTRQKAIRACLERNPNAFRPKIGKTKSGGPDIVRRHTKGCNCKRSGCLKNYCECYEAKIACTVMCKCVGCRNIEESMERRRDVLRLRDKLVDPAYRPPLPRGQLKQPCNFMTREVIEAVAQCMLATVGTEAREHADPVEDILLEFSRCMADIISASHHAL